MSYEYSKTKQVRLRDVGKDEKWLQDLNARHHTPRSGLTNFPSNK